MSSLLYEITGLGFSALLFATTSSVAVSLLFTAETVSLARFAVDIGNNQHKLYLNRDI